MNSATPPRPDFITAIEEVQGLLKQSLDPVRDLDGRGGEAKIHLFRLAPSLNILALDCPLTLALTNVVPHDSDLI